MSQSLQIYLLIITMSLGLVACTAEPIASFDSVYYNWDGQRVLCATSIDSRGLNSVESILGGIRRADDEQRVLLLYGHEPGRHFSLDVISEILEEADRLAVPFLTVEDLDKGNGGAGIALSFDDHHIDEWYDMTRSWPSYGAVATFNVTRPHRLSAGSIQKLEQMVQEGHAIGAHGLEHQNGPDYVDEFGLDTYIDDEVLPSINILRDLDFSVNTFAYPQGHRTDELDREILKHVAFVRTLTMTATGLSSPCPY